MISSVIVPIIQHVPKMLNIFLKLQFLAQMDIDFN